MAASPRMLRHAVDALPARTLRWQARRAELLSRAPPLDPWALPASVSLTPGRDHARHARRAGIASAVLGVISAFMLRDESVLPEFRLLACLPLAVCLWLTVDFLHLSRVLPQRLTLSLSAAGLGIETERRSELRPFSDFAGVAVRSRVLSRGLPERHLRRRSVAELRDRAWERRTLHWIELTHDDPRQSAPLWVLTGHDAFDRARVLRTARDFAAALGLPLLSTGGIDPAEAERAGAAPGLAAAPPELRAMAAREAVAPEAVVREAIGPAPRAASRPPRPAASTGRAAALYATAVLVAGGALWLVRVAGLEADRGLATAVAIEMALLLGVCIVAAWVIDLAANVPPRLDVRLRMAAAALSLLLASEVALSHLLLDESFGTILAGYVTPHGLLRLTGQSLAALIPALFLLMRSPD